MIGNSDDETKRQVANLHRAFTKHTSTNMIQSGGFLGRLLGPLLKTGLPLMKSVIKPIS